VSSIRFYLDENVTNEIAEGLRTLGIDVLTTAEAGNIEASDTEQLAFALAEKRVIITKDDDFLVLGSKDVEHAGIVYYKQQTRSVKEVLGGLKRLYDNASAEEMVNLVRFL
jgi:predicted nuclease of predicted toxin-antitoxin system